MPDLNNEIANISCDMDLVSKHLVKNINDEINQNFTHWDNKEHGSSSVERGVNSVDGGFINHKKNSSDDSTIRSNNASQFFAGEGFVDHKKASDDFGVKSNIPVQDHENDYYSLSINFENDYSKTKKVVKIKNAPAKRKIMFESLKASQKELNNSLIFLEAEEKQLNQKFETKKALLETAPNKEKIEKEIKTLEEKLTKLKSKIKAEGERNSIERDEIKELELIEKQALKELEKRGQGNVTSSIPEVAVEKRSTDDQTSLEIEYNKGIEILTKEINPIVDALFYVPSYKKELVEASRKSIIINASNLSMIIKLLEFNFASVQESALLLRLIRNHPGNRVGNLSYLIMQIEQRSQEKSTGMDLKSIKLKVEKSLNDYFFTILRLKIKSHPLPKVDARFVNEEQKIEEKKYLLRLGSVILSTVNKEAQLNQCNNYLKLYQHKGFGMFKGVDKSDTCVSLDERFNIYCSRLNEKPVLVQSNSDILIFLALCTKEIRKNEEGKKDKVLTSPKNITEKEALIILTKEAHRSHSSKCLYQQMYLCKLLSRIYPNLL